MPGIMLSQRDSFDDAYRKFKRQCDRNLIVTEARARQNHETETEKRKKEKIATRKKILKKLFMLRRYESVIFTAVGHLPCDSSHFFS